MNESINEKSYSRHGYDSIPCPNCYGRGSEALSVFTKVPCRHCKGDGQIMREGSREMEVATQRQTDNRNDRKDRWLFDGER
jgi:DnaJ-class molecular chaperone